jgi:hypothetical protein
MLINHTQERLVALGLAGMANRRHDAGDLARYGAIAAVDQKTVLIDDNRVNETVCLDVRSENGQFLVGHHREQIGDRVDRPLGGLRFGHRRALRLLGEPDRLAT